MSKQLTNIKEMEKINRPREKMSRLGAESLSDAELLALIIGSGSKDRKLHEICHDLVKVYDAKGLEVSMNELKEIKGIGISRCTQLQAIFEFARRRMTPSRYRIQHPSDVLPLLLPYADKKQEYFLCISLNGAYEVIKTRVVSIGLLNRTMVHPREVFADPIMDRAAAIIVSHNHPSGNLEPSAEDREITSRLRKAGEIIGITLLDHIIISEKGHFSFLKENYD